MRRPKKIKSARAKNHRSKKATVRKGVSQEMIRVFRRRNRNKKSDLETKFTTWLEEAGIPYRWQHAVGRCHVDFCIEPELLIEVNGCFFHGHGKCQKELSPRQRAWRIRDSRRYAFLKKKGQLMLVWGCEMERRKEEFLRRIEKYREENPL